MTALKKGVYVLPNFFTSLSLFCGFYSVVATMQTRFVHAAWAIVIAAVFDGLDGRVARLTRTTSRFGVEYDSLADLVAFGIAPGVLAYGWQLDSCGRLGWLAAFLYVACGAIRLARFNVQAGPSATRYFLGLPIPAAAGMIAGTVIFCMHVGIVEHALIPPLLVAVLYGMAFLMVSTIHFKSFKEFDLHARKPFNTVVGAILIICVFASEPQFMLFAAALGYVVSGPVGYVRYLVRRHRRKEQPLVHAEENHEHKD